MVVGASTAFAQSSDMLKWRASVGKTSNDNFFNTSTAPVSETTTSETLGVNLSLPYSLQRFELDASVVSNQYQTNANFNYTGTNFNANWIWSLTPRLHGSLKSTRVETLNTSTDSVDPTQRNKSTVQNSEFSGAFELGGPWQLTAGLVNNNSVSERAVVGQSDDHSNGASAGVRYALASGNSLGYFHQTAQGVSSFNYVYSTDDVAVGWVLSGNTTLTAHIANVQQRFEAAPWYDFGGTTGGANLSWRITGKTTVAVDWQRLLTSYQTGNASYTQADYYTVVPTWQISPITTLRMQYRNGVLSDQGSPFGASSQRQDHLQDTSFSFIWQAHRLLTLTATVSESSRSSNQFRADFTARSYALLAALSI